MRTAASLFHNGARSQPPPGQPPVPVMWRRPFLGFLVENVLDLGSQDDRKVMEWYFSQQRAAGLVIKVAEVKAAQWRTGLWPKRLWIVGLRKDVAAVVGFGSLEPPMEHIIPREGEFKAESGLIGFAKWDWGVDQWYPLNALPAPLIIRWGKDYDTPEKRSAVELPSKDRPIPPRWMGYLAAGWDDQRTFTGSKVMHSKWRAVLITSISTSEGLGATPAFYYVPGTEKEQEHITTIPVMGHLQAFGLEDFNFKSSDGFYKMRCMGQMGAPQVAETMANWSELLLNKYHRLTRTPPPSPEVPAC